MSGPLSERALQRLLALAAAGDDLPPSPPLPERYRIVRELGRGGMGVVYEAFDTQLGRPCALKRIGAATGADDELRRRFAREALAAARLRHPHIAAVYDATPDFIALQLVAGGPIDAIPPGERRLLVELVRDAARALHHAHTQGIVHRDVKPSNLLVEGRHVYVVDFGLAKEIAPADARTHSGVVVGTPSYMPPEQAQGRTDAIDARSDVYALGATLWRCLTGAPPFVAADLPTLLRKVVEEEPPPPRVERDLDLVLRKCLAKEPAQRYADADALATDLDRWLRSEPVQARRPSLGYRLAKMLQRRRAVLRAAGWAAAAAVVVTALVLGPIALRESAAGAAASEAVALSERVGAVLQDAAVFTRLGDQPSALEALDGGITAAHEFLERHEVARVRHLLSRLLRARGRSDLALAELERALAADPALAEARFERGLTLAAQTTLTEAERARAVADLATPIGARSVLTSIDLLHGRAERDRLEGRHERAKELLEELLAYEPTHVAAWLSLSRVALALGEDDLARHYAASAMDVQLGHGPIYLARETRALPTVVAGLDGALVDFARELADGPDLALALAQRGIVQLRRALRLAADGNRDQALAAALAAVEDCDATLAIHPHLAGARNNRAVARLEAARLHAAAGDAAAAEASRTRAQADLAQALAAAPDLAEIHFNRGTLQLRLAEDAGVRGLAEIAAVRLAAARTAFARALALAPPGWPHRRSCRTRLDEAASAAAAR